MESPIDYHTARAMLEWQIDLGVTETICDAPIDRFEAVQEPAKIAPVKPIEMAETTRPPIPAAAAAVDCVAEAQALADQATTLGDLAQLQAGFDHCELKRGARNFVFADGTVGAKLLILGEAPGRDEDQAGKPFVGAAGHLLDQMLAAIGMARTGEAPVYITNVMPWRPPQNRDPSEAEIAMMMPFVAKHIALAAPDVIVLLGNVACQAAMGRKGITRLRGEWSTAFGKPVMPMFHPAYLVRNAAAKREAWADLLAVQARLRDGE